MSTAPSAESSGREPELGSMWLTIEVLPMRRSASMVSRNALQLSVGAGTVGQQRTEDRPIRLYMPRPRAM